MEDALMNNLVLETVFKYTAAEDLAAHRLVCRKWHDTLFSRWRATAILNVIPSLECRESEEVEVVGGKKIWKERIKPVKGITLWELYEEMGMDVNSKDNDDHYKISWREKPFVNYRLKYWDLKNGALWDTVFPEFWFRIGSKMKTLWLDQCNFLNGTPEILREILHMYARNLEGLTLTCNSHSILVVDRTKDEDGSGVVISSSRSNCNYNPTMHVSLKRLQIDGSLNDYKELFGEFPNLEMVTVSNVTSMSDIDGMARSMARVSLQLKHMDCLHSGHHSLPFLHQRFQAEVWDWTFPLEYLAFPIKDRRNAIDLVSHLERYAETLKTLKIFGDPFSEAIDNLTFYTSMRNLTELELSGNMVKNLCFMQWMPNLKKLTFNLAAFEMREQITERLERVARLWDEDAPDVLVQFRHDIILESVERGMSMTFTCLETLSIDFEFDVPSLNILKTTMPNLKCLRTILNNVTLREVYELWTDLEELECMFGSRVDDVGITGVVADLYYEGGRLRDITSFTCLKRFKLKAFCAGGRITDFSCDEGFLWLNCLQSLELWVCNTCISALTEIKLNEKISHVKIVRNSHQKHKTENLECCERIGYELACKRDPFAKDW